MKNSLILLLVLFFSVACSQSRMRLPKPKAPPVTKQKTIIDYSDTRAHSYRTRGSLPIANNRYEGSLWRDESSWGNLLRDHRARFRNDVLTITRLKDIIVIAKPTPKPAPIPAAAAKGKGPNATLAKVNQVLDAASALTGKNLVEEEQNEVLKALKSISARVVQVLPNGNMVIVGEKIDYRQQNTVRYVTKIKGIIRPEDVTDKNEIGSIKLARSEVQIKRQIIASKLNFRGLSPIIGRQKAGVLDRLSHLATPVSTNKTQSVPTK